MLSCDLSHNPPIVIIGYSRWQTIGQCLRNLSACHGVGEHDCFLFLDAPYRKEDVANCMKMREVAEEVRVTRLPNLNIIVRDRNYGVPGNLISAITEIVKRYGRVIFFEDDVLVSKTFLEYMDVALKKYDSDPRIFCVNGFKSPYLRIPRTYKGDIYLNPRNMAWGFGIWKDRWEQVDFLMSDWNDFKKSSHNLDRLTFAGEDIKGLIEAQLSGRIHTWDVQCSYYMVKNNLYAVEPRYSLTKNIGFGHNSGVHCGAEDYVIRRMKYYDFLPDLEIDLSFSKDLGKRFKCSTMDFSISGRVLRGIRRLIRRFASYNDESVSI